MELISSIRFSSGVPVRTNAYRLRSFLTAFAVLVCQFLMRWASSRMTTSGCNVAIRASPSPRICS